MAVPDQASSHWILVGSVRRNGVSAYTEGEGPCCQQSGSCVDVHVCGAPDGAGGWRHLGESDTRPSENRRAETVNMSELLKAVRDCSIDFSAQLFAREASLSLPE